MLDVKLVERLTQDRERFAEFSPRECEIRIDSDIPHNRKMLALLHEIIEAIVGQYEIDIEHEELSTLTNVLHQVLCDNSLTWGNNK